MNSKIILCIACIFLLPACKEVKSNTPAVVASSAAGAPAESPKFKKVCTTDIQTSKKTCTTVRVREKHNGTPIP